MKSIMKSHTGTGPNYLRIILMTLLLVGISKEIHGQPLPTEDEIRKTFDEQKSEFNAFWERVKNTLYGREGEKMRFTDILIVIAILIVAFVFITCIIGFLFCECIKKICCCCC